MEIVVNPFSEQVQDMVAMISEEYPEWQEPDFDEKEFVQFVIDLFCTSLFVAYKGASIPSEDLQKILQTTYTMLDMSTETVQ